MKTANFLILFLICGLSFSSNAQTNKAKKKPVKKVVVVKKPVVKKPESLTLVVAGGYSITGVAKNFAAGTAVSLIDQQTNETERSTTIKNGTFFMTGKVDQPSFKTLVIDGNISTTLFLDNSKMKVAVDKNDPEKLAISGSSVNDQFRELNTSITPYQVYFAGEDFDPEAINRASSILDTFIKKYPASQITPLAVFRYYQLTSNGQKAEEYYNMLSSDVRQNFIAQYLYAQILESKNNAVGSVLTDFTQTDAEGNNFTLSSLKGKYVLVDFWASWCRPCRMENPNIVAAYNQFKDKNFTVLGVSLDKSKAAWTEAIRMDSLNWKQVSDLNGWANAVAVNFGIQSIPQNFLLDPEGKIIAKNLRGGVLVKRLQAVLR